MVAGKGLKTKLHPLGNSIKSQEQEHTYYAWANGGTTIYTQNNDPEPDCDYIFTSPNEIGDIVAAKSGDTITSNNVIYTRDASNDRDDLVTDFYFEININPAEFVLPINSSSYINPITVYWGDGNSEVINNQVEPSHIYTTAGTYQIRIHADSGKMPYCTWQADEWEFGNKLIRFKSALLECYNNSEKTWSFGYFCYQCSSLISIPRDLFKYNLSVRDFDDVFCNCRSLIKIPHDLFKYHTEVTHFGACFEGCSSLTNIPKYLFRYHKYVDDFFGCFSYCSKLKLNPDIFCDEATEMSTRFANVSPDFYSCFNIYVFTGERGTAPQLWNYTYKNESVSDSSLCFEGHSTNSLTNYNDIPDDWKS